MMYRPQLLVFAALTFAIAITPRLAEAQDKAPKDLKTATNQAADAPKSGWDFDGSLGVPKLQSNSFSLALDANLGYLGQNWGGLVGLGVSNVAIQKDSTLSTTSRVRFNADLSHLSGSAADATRVEWRAELAYLSYSTSYSELPSAASSTYSNAIESSAMTRVTGLLGLRSRNADNLSYNLLAGVGFQNEAYAQSSVNDSGSNPSDSNFSAASSVRFVGRLRARHRTVPSVLDIRPELEIGTFSLRRLSFFTGGDMTTAPEVQTYRQIDLSARLFGDITKFQFAGLVPSVFAGLDYVSISGDSGSASTVIPIGGIGLISAMP